jgi:hypothetical protein
MDKENGVQEKQACGKVGEEIVYCIDGKYRWTYEFDLLKNPSILFVVLKILLSVMLGILVFVTLFDIGRPDYFWTGFLANLKIFGIIMLATVVISVLGYLLYAAMMGGKYCVVFAMDEKGILHEQQARQAKKASLIGDLLVLAGAVTGNLTTVGIGMTHGSRNAMYTAFTGTKKLTGVRRKNTIILREGLSSNRVWCEDEDFDFVWNYIKARCERAEVITQ